MKTFSLFGAARVCAVSTVCLWLLCTLPAANASTVVYDGGDVTGILDLEVNGGIWNVDFVSSPNSATEWTTALEAFDATIALILLFNEEEPVPVWVKAGDTGLSGITFVNLFAPSMNVSGAFYGQRISALWDVVGPADPPYPQEFYARFSAVPVPAAVWLFGSGLLGLIGVARRKKAA